MNLYLNDLLPVNDAEENSHDDTQRNLHEKNILIIDVKDHDVQKECKFHKNS